MTAPGRVCPRVWAVLLISAVTAWSCSSEPRESKDTSARISFWQFWNPEVIQPLIHRFELEHPNVRVEVEQRTWHSGPRDLEAALAAGKGPDICELTSTWLPRFAATGALVDLTDQVAPMHEDDPIWDAATVDGRVFGVPWIMATRALVFNRSLFEHADLDPDLPPETWEELLDAAARIDSLGPDVHGFGINTGDRHLLYKKFMPFAFGNGGRILNEDHTRSLVDSPEMIEALEFYVRLADHALMGPQDVLDRAFAEGALGMQVSGAWQVRTLPESAPELEFDVALVPKPSAYAGTHGSYADSEVLVLFAGTPHRDAALELARFLVRSDMAVRFCGNVVDVQPAAAGAEGDPYYTSRPYERLFVEQLRSAMIPPAHAEWIRMETVLNAAIEEALSHRKGPGDALEEASRRIQELLDD